MQKIKQIMLGGLAAVVLVASNLSCKSLSNLSKKEIAKFSLPSIENCVEEYVKKYGDKDKYARDRYGTECVERHREYIKACLAYINHGYNRTVSRKDANKCDFVNFNLKFKHYGSPTGDPIEGVEAFIIGYRLNDHQTNVPLILPNGEKVDYLKIKTGEDGKFDAKFKPEKDVIYIAWVEYPGEISEELKNKLPVADYFPLILTLYPPPFLVNEAEQGLCVEDIIFVYDPLKDKFR